MAGTDKEGFAMQGRRMLFSGWKKWQAALVLTVATVAPSAHSASKTILVLGDSLSAEYGIQRGSGWVTLLEKQMNKEGISASVVNASISGETTSGGRTRLPALLDRHKPSIVIIELGANDALRGMPLSSSEDNLRSMIQAAKKADADPLLVGMKIPPNYGREYTERFSASYTKVAKDTNVPLVPFFLEGVAQNPALFQSDRLHPTAEAQPVMFNNVWPYLKPLLKQ